ncbi:MAG: ATPase, T2SS/T4P/T4SS family [Victivallaceae bacterium]|nr:ATPase, T2SS/T4P/T4SS family [Victivallaceae bacterium]
MLDTASQALRDLLLQEGIATDAQLNEMEEEQSRSGKSLFEVVVDFGHTSETELMRLIAGSLNTEVVDLENIVITGETIALMTPDTARTYGAIPVEFSDGILRVALREPLNYQIHDDLRFIQGTDIIPLVAPPEQIDTAIEKYYPPDMSTVRDVLEVLKNEDKNTGLEDVDLSAASEAPIVKYVDAVISQAIKDKASDIHFEPFEKEFRIRYRVDGALYEMPPPPLTLASAIISRIKILSNLDIAERRIPQDGRIQKRYAGRPVDLRVSCLPTTHGESVVLRVLDRTVVNLQLDSLGINTTVLEKLREMIHLPNGILLVTGPTGSGKTTTLYSALSEINVIGDKLLTAEDPVEYDIEGLIQVPINDAVGMTFHRALRAFLRQDPDRILVGEIRDFETAQTAIEASLTGHFVFSTLHTNDAAGAITRLVDMGVEPFLVCSSLVGVLAQRLIRRVCPNCKTAYVPNDEELARLDLDRADLGNRKFYYGRGCPVCNHTGYKGRKAITELLVITPEIVELISSNAPSGAIQAKARENGMTTVREDGLMAILNGETSVDEVLRYT